MIDYMHFKSKRITQKQQFGFRNNHSTTHTLTEITKSIRKSCDNGLYSCGVFLDLKNNTINNKILISKLEYYQIRGKAKDWFGYFIYTRWQFISIDEQNSELNKISHGVICCLYNNLHYTVIQNIVWHFAGKVC